MSDAYLESIPEWDGKTEDYDFPSLRRVPILASYWEKYEPLITSALSPDTNHKNEFQAGNDFQAGTPQRSWLRA